MKFSLAARALCFCWLAGSALAGEMYENPVIPGDHPDPSIIRDGRVFWAVSTSSEWGPQFPLLRSEDLVNWEQTGSVFPRRPAWAVANFWAPEISEYKGRFFVYYVGRKHGGALAVAVATASKPEGPYTDHGPLVSQDDGSIDPVPVTDEHGQRYLLWKEDGNSRHQPSILWAQALTDDGLTLMGEPKELLRNDTPWEGAVVEGPFVLRRGDWFYLFYSGSGCCGGNCDYALGVARSHSLLGPWEKNPANPILSGNRAWRCPGHGSITMDAR
ncbi:MAG TPA: glycoside hydrolase family 43 protein, partial [Verrucomicrobiae bacterium]|nr:glycoside hydrolase family 43 protein [Verrucomicrobiae bacterium]